MEFGEFLMYKIRAVAPNELIFRALCTIALCSIH